MAARSLSHLPESYAPIPFPGLENCPLKLCLVVSKKPGTDRLLPLGINFFTRQLLGCMVDMGGRLHQWLVIEFQNSPTLAPATLSDRWNNATLDHLWLNACAALDHVAAGAYIRTEWESTHPGPLCFNPASSRMEYFSPADKPPYALCRDEGVLATAGLESYAGSGCRYLSAAAPDGTTEFLSVVGSSSAASATDAMVARGLIPINPGCFFIRCRAAAPVDVASVASVLGGMPWSGIAVGRELVNVGSLVEILGENVSDQTTESLFLSRHGNWGKVVEALHLKIKMLCDMTQQVHAAIQRTGRPFLNLSMDSFALHFSPPSVGLPFLWTQQTHLVDAGIAVALKLSESAPEIFTCGATFPPSVFKPARAGRQAIAGHANFRIRSVTTDSGGQAIVDGTLDSMEFDPPTGSELISIRFSLADQSCVLFGFSSGSAAKAELSFRSTQASFPAAIAKVLAAAQGAILKRVWVDTWENMDSAYDMYALAVCFCQVLLAGPANPLSSIVDDLNSLAGILASSGEKRYSQLAAMLAGGGQFSDTLGVANLFSQPALRDAAAEMIPAEVWYKLVETLVLMIPGIMPDAFARPYGSLRAGGQAAAFQKLQERLVNLLTQTRSLILIDWRMNREIHSAVRRLTTGM